MRNVRRNKKNINFFEVLQVAQKNRKSKANTKMMVFICICVPLMLALFVGSYLMLKNSTQQLQVQNDALNQFLQSPQTLQRKRNSNELQLTVNALREYNRQCASYIEVLKQSKRLSADLFAEIERCMPEATVIDQYAFSKDTLRISGHSQNNSEPSEFAKRLDATQKFDTVAYSGFTGSGENKSVQYSFVINCKLW